MEILEIRWIPGKSRQIPLRFVSQSFIAQTSSVSKLEFMQNFYQALLFFSTVLDRS